MPPSPITATVAPGHTFAVWIAAPTPVDTPHPRRHARSSGMPSGSGMASRHAQRFGSRACRYARTPDRGAPSGARQSRGGWVQACEHRLGSQKAGDRCRTGPPTTGPHDGPVGIPDPSPTRSTIPAPSWPSSRRTHAPSRCREPRGRCGRRRSPRCGPGPHGPPDHRPGSVRRRSVRLPRRRSLPSLSCHAAPVASAGLPILPRVNAGTLRDIAARVRRLRRALESMVNVDCGTYTPGGVNPIADLCETRFARRLGRRAPSARAGRRRRAARRRVVGRLPGQPAGRACCWSATWTRCSTTGPSAERPFRVDGDARRPRRLGHEGRAARGLVAPRCLQDAGFDDFGAITYVCNPDEEIGSPFSGPIIRELAPRARRCFVLEGARENGDIVSARKGVADIRITSTAARRTPAWSPRRAGTRCSRPRTRSSRCTR